MKAVSRGQALEVSGRVGTQVDWDQIDGDKLQTEVISLPPEEFGRRFTMFLRAGARFILGGLKVLVASFNPEKFLGAKWAAIPEEQDKASAILTEVDFATADFITCLEKGESSITGEEKLARLKKAGRIRYGATVFMGLWQNYLACENKAESTLEKLYQQKGITYMDFFGDVLRNPDGRRCVLYLYRCGAGSWSWSCRWLGDDWGSRDFTAVSQQVSE